MKFASLLFALLALPLFSQEPVPVKEPAANASQATWRSYATYLKAVVAYRDAQLVAAKIDSAKIDTIAVGIAAINTKLSALPALPVGVAPTITTQPANIVSQPGATVAFSVVATGNPAPTLQWWRNGITFASWTGASLTLYGVSSNDVGSYTVVATSAAGSATSVPATLTLSTSEVPPTPPVITPANPDDAFAGSNVTFGASADGNPAPTFTWKKNGVLIPGATSATLQLLAVTAANSGDYVAVATNSQGSAVSPPAKLNVIPAP